MPHIAARRGLALAFVAGSLIAATPAAAAPQWNDGVSTQSTLFNCVLGIPEAGALAYAGYQADPANLPKPGEVFYGHAVFGAAMEACAGDQFGELDVVLPPGVSLAIDAAHPVKCFYEDNQGPTLANPTCPSRPVNGVYGPQFPAGDGGGPWDMPAGRLLEVEFPLTTSRQLKGPAGGHCPQDASELAIYAQHDCLITPLHIADGSLDPWLFPDEELVTAASPPAGGSPPPPPSGSPAPGGTQPTPVPSPPTPAATLRAPRRVKLAALLSHGLKVTLALPGPEAAATLTLRSGHRRLAQASRRHLQAGRLSVRLQLSRAARRRLRHAHRVQLRLTATLRNPAATLRATVVARR